PKRSGEKGKHKGLNLTLTVLAGALVVPMAFLLLMALRPRPGKTAEQQTVTVAATNTISPAAGSPLPTRAPGTGSALPVLAKTMDRTVSNPPAFQAPSLLAEAPRLRPLPPKLQAILFDPVRPAAMIDGRTIYVNSQVGAFRVVAIRADGVLLAN